MRGGVRLLRAGVRIPAPPAVARSARMAVASLFALLGAIMGSWAGRIPGVRGQVGVDDAQWGAWILAAPAGSLLGLLWVKR